MHSRHGIISTEELGELTLVASGTALVGVYFPDHTTKPDRTSFGEKIESTTDPVLSEASSQLRQYLQGARTTFDLSTAAHGNAFEQRVWTLLHEIRFGQTTTYGDLGETLGDRALARRVGQAVGRNPLSVIVGCHRVIGKNGALRGYAGGLSRKQFLLDLEARAAAS